MRLNKFYKVATLLVLLLLVVVEVHRLNRECPCSEEQDDRTLDLREAIRVDPPEDNATYRMFVGIVSAKRDPPTVVRMVERLVSSAGNTSLYKFLVWQSWSAAEDAEAKRSVREELEGLGAVVLSPGGRYPQLKPGRLKLTLDDSEERVKWRACHVLDYVNLLEAALYHHSEFVLILEDDLLPAKAAIEKAYQFALYNDHLKDWGFLTLYSGVRRQQYSQDTTDSCVCGGCAFVYRPSFLLPLINFLRSNLYEAPVDIMILSYVTLTLKKSIYERTPNLFQHISPRSSYTGKDQAGRHSEQWRSRSFEYNEENTTLYSLPQDSTNYLGCFADSAALPEDRDLVGLFSYGKKASPQLCAEFCSEYYFYGLQFGSECYCSNEFGRYGQVSESQCNMPCNRDSSHICGGTNVNSVYRTNSIKRTVIPNDT